MFMKNSLKIKISSKMFFFEINILFSRVNLFINFKNAFNII